MSLALGHDGRAACAQEDAEEPGTAYLAGQGPPINDEDDPDEYEGEDQPESEDFEEGDDDGAEGETTAGVFLGSGTLALSPRESCGLAFCGPIDTRMQTHGVLLPQTLAQSLHGAEFSGLGHRMLKHLSTSMKGLPAVRQARPARSGSATCRRTTRRRKMRRMRTRSEG